MKAIRKKFCVVLIFCLIFLIGCSAQSNIKPETELSYSGFRPIGNTSIMNDRSLWGELNVHDPAIIKAGDYYYVYSTDASYGDMHPLGIQIRRSKDLITWEYLGTAFSDYENDCAEVIKHAKLDVKAHNGLWAPDIVKVGDTTYRLYFSASTFGSSRSAIALAESNSPEGPFTYKGVVVKSDANASKGPNAIDPAIISDTDGNMYMSYGSFSGGIFIEPLDNESGFIQQSSERIRIAGSQGASIEASAIVYMEQSDYFYLFMSYGSLSSDYNIRVGRSKEVTGPYLDANGNDLASLNAFNADVVGTKLVGGYTFKSDPGVPPTKGYMAPGHNSILAEDGNYYLVHHVRTYALPDYWFTMNIRAMYLNKYDWPVVMPNRYYGETLQPIQLPDGDYGLVEHLSDTNSDAHISQIITLSAGNVSGNVKGTYQIYDDYKIELTLDGQSYDGIVMKQYDWERDSEVYAFSAMSENGLAIWGNTQF